VALIDRKPATASTFGPANDDQVADIITRLVAKEAIDSPDVWQLVERIEADRVRAIDLTAALDQHETAATLNQATFDGQQVRAQIMAEALMSVRAACVRLGHAALVEEIDAALAGVPAVPTPVEPVSPTVAIGVLAQAIWHIIDHRVGLAENVMINGGLLREVR